VTPKDYLEDMTYDMIYGGIADVSSRDVQSKSYLTDCLAYNMPVYLSRKSCYITGVECLYIDTSTS